MSGATKDGAPAPVARAWALGLGAALLLLALFAWRRISDWDMGDHLACGQRILEQGPRWVGYPLVDTYGSHPFINLAWLWQAMVAVLQRLGGFGALSALNVALALGLGFVALGRLRLRGIVAPLSAALLAFSAMAIEFRMQVRPEQASWVFLSLELLCLEQARQGHRRWLAALPFAHLAWCNTHGNLAMLGLLAQGAFFVSAWIRERRLPAGLGLCLGACLLAGFLTPFWGQGFLHPFRLWGRLQEGDAFKAVVGEFISPWADLPRPYPVYGVWAYRLGAPLLLALLALAWRSLVLEDLLLCLGFFLVSLSGVRNTPLFFIAAAPSLGLALQSLATRGKAWQGFLERAWPAWLFSAIILLAGLRVVTGAWYASEGRQVRFGSGIAADERLPLGAARYLVRYAPQARFFNSTEYGGWLCFATGHAVFQDGQTEVMEQATYHSLIEPTFAPGGLAALLDKERLDLMVYHLPNYETYTKQMSALPGWRLAYYDDWAALWMRDGAFPAAPRVDWAQEARLGPGLPSEAEIRSQVAAPLPKAWRCFLAGFLAPSLAVSGEANRAVFAWQSGSGALAEALLLDALSKDPRSGQAWHNLGVAYGSQGRWDLARLAWQHCLECDPNDRLAVEAVLQLQDIPWS